MRIKWRKDRIPYIIAALAVGGIAVVTAVIMSRDTGTTDDQPSQSEAAAETAARSRGAITGGEGLSADRHADTETKDSDQHVEPKDMPEVMPLIDEALVIFADSDTAIVNGEEKKTDSKPFISDGEMVYSLNKTAEFLGAEISVDDNTNIVTVLSNGCKAQFMTGFNVIVYNNTDPKLIRSKPVLKDDQIYLPVDVLADIMNCSSFRDYQNGIAVLRGKKAPDKESYAALLSLIGRSYESDRSNSELDELEERFSDYDIYDLSRSGRLYISNENGEIYKRQLLDDYTLTNEKQDAAYTFDKNEVYAAGSGSDSGNLYLLKSPDSVYSETPETMIKKDLIFAIERYIDLSIGGDDTELDIYKKAIKGEIDNDFLQLKDEALGNGTYTEITSAAGEDQSVIENRWAELCAEVRPGDILLFRNSASDSKYGYFNHSAMVMDVSGQTIHVLQARNSELGVGADMPEDFITAESFKNDGYWKHYDSIVLCRVNDISETAADGMVRTAYEKYNGYAFGYGGFYGAKEVTCAEIIKNAMQSSGVELIDGKEQRHRLKSAVKGDVLSMLILPDDIVLSDSISILKHIK